MLLEMIGSYSHSQVVISAPSWEVTFEGYANLTMGTAVRSDTAHGAAPDPVAFDGAGRVLARLVNQVGPNIGVRLVTEATNSDVDLSEASILLFGSGGRLEIGKRMGLPDVLTGYAPNSFTFTTAEFGPPTGRTLDPGGGLQTQFLRANLRSRVEPLAARGVTASLFNDESAKILYVAPKHNGWLGGASFSPNADDPRFGKLVQFGLVHESYWRQNIWRWGGTYAHAQADRIAIGASARDLDSLSLGTSITLNDSLDLGVSATYDGRGGAVEAIGDAPSAWGASASINYNSGPWTVGGYYQFSRGAVPGGSREGAHLSAFELGTSYRFTTRVRLYGAAFLYELTNDSRGRDPIRGRGATVTLGLRATL